jgi:hypothetical protein
MERWYPLFQRYTFQTDFIRLDDVVVAYLKSDCMQIVGTPPSDSDTEEETPPSFPQLESHIQQILQKYPVFVKCNDTAPQDAAFFNAQSLECRTVYDLFLLLKTSDFVQFALREWKYPSVLALREYFSLNRMLEYRCFVNEWELVCVSQRDVGQSYGYVVSEWQTVLKRISEFMDEIVIPRLRELRLAHVAVDLYVLERRILVVDLNPRLPMTDGYLYTYEEWREGIVSVPLMRIVRPGQEVRGTQFSHNKVPKEMIDFSHGNTTLDFLEALSRE